MSAPAESAAPPPTLHDPLSSPVQQAWSFAGTMLRSYGPAAIAAGHAVFHPPTTNVNAITAPNATARRKTVEDLARAPKLQSKSDDRLYPQEILHRTTGLSSDRRTVSATAALAGTTNAAKASASVYSSYTRAQLRQRRLELERELASLESSGSGSASASASSRARSTSPGEDMASVAPHSPASTLPVISSPNKRERHISAPTPTHPPRLSPLSGYGMGGLDASAYEQIGREDVDNANLPEDWGKEAKKTGWKGAPPALVPNERPPAHQKRSSWFWNGGGHPDATATASASGQAKKDA